MLCGAAAFVCLLALLSYSPLDPSLNTASELETTHAAPRNLIGLAGSYSADLLFQIFGLVTFMLPVGLGVLSWKFARSEAVEAPWVKAIGITMLTGALAGGLGLQPLVVQAFPRFAWQWRGAIPPSGLLGRILADQLLYLFNVAGTLVLLNLALLAAVYLLTAFSISELRNWLAEHSTWWAAWQKRRAEKEAVTEKSRRERVEAQYKAEIVKLDNLQKTKKAPLIPVVRVRFGPKTGPEPAPVSTPPPAVKAPPPRVISKPEVVVDAITRMEMEGQLTPTAPSPIPLPRSPSAAEPPMGEPLVTAPAPPPPPSKPRVLGKSASFKLPSTALLREPDRQEALDEDDLKRLAQVLTLKCAEFDVTGTVTQINPGPVVTTFELKPEAGIKYSRITNLVDDLCLAMEAESILIERIPGKSTVGIEVPNHKRETIYLRELVESPEFSNSHSKLTLGLGKEINGKLRVAELNTMPHLLMAGSTGTGKSVCLNSILLSILYKATPDDVRLILVDPKRLEMGLYDGVPHLLTPIITEPKLAAHALRNAVKEMERRLKVLAEKGVRNIDQYNRLFDKPRTLSLFTEDGQPNSTEETKLPYIVIIIDELADLMMVDSNNVEASITRLAQMARAVGIHLILATQRPSVDVITGLIKANFPARISFRVATKVDSRTILDANGAESLLGRGDMLYLPSGSGRLLRVHGPLVTEDEINKVVDFWRKQSQPSYEVQYLAPPPCDDEPEEGGEGGEFEGEEDPMYEEAVRVIVEAGKASTSILQRRLRLGYGRAARLLDMMQRDGIISPPDGSKPREVLKRPDWYAEVDNQLR